MSDVRLRCAARLVHHHEVLPAIKYVLRARYSDILATDASTHVSFALSGNSLCPSHPRTMFLAARHAYHVAHITPAPPPSYLLVIDAIEEICIENVTACRLSFGALVIEGIQRMNLFERHTRGGLDPIIPLIAIQ